MLFFPVCMLTCIGRLLRNFLFPPLCLHCQLHSPTLFCKGCAAAFECIDPFTSCPFCGEEHLSQEPCLLPFKARARVRLAATVDDHPPTRTLATKLCSGQMPYLATSAAALMVVQLERLGWPLPDLLIPLPDSQGANRQLAQALGYFWKRPIKNLLKLLDGSPENPSPSLQTEGEALSFYGVRRGKPLSPSSVLLVSLYMHRAASLHHAAYALQERSPEALYALTFLRCHTNHNP